jgi:hypothetical protein
VKSWESESLKRQLPNLVLDVDFTSLDFLEIEVWEAGWEEALDKVWAEV